MQKPDLQCGSPKLRGLYAVTQEDHLLPRLSALVGAALAGGVRLVQYRNKSSPSPLRRAQAAELLRLCHACDARLIINDDLPLALELGADGVHLGRDDAKEQDLAVIRAELGPQRILGVTCYDDLARAEAAAAAGASYLAFGSMFPSKTKPQATRAPLSLLGEAKRRFNLPVAAIGGICIANAAQAIAAGADLLAVSSDLFDTMDIGERANEFQTLFNGRQ